MANKYIKSTSTFVKQSKHQDINDGSIFERDWYTTGAVNKFLPNQTPIYNNGNFIITVNNDYNQIMDYETNGFEKINGEELWTLDGINKAENANAETSGITAENLSYNKTYDLRDFAYFGSCMEMIRGSINDIFNRFPGELFCSNVPQYFSATMLLDEHGNPLHDEVCNEIIYVHSRDDINYYYEIDGQEAYLVSNPFNINIHTKNIDPKDESLKYFANSGYTKYEIIEGNATNGTPITSFNVTPNPCECHQIGGVIAEIDINGHKIYYVKGQDSNLYLHTSEEGLHIRPKREYIDEFFDSLDNFQAVILNRKTTPKYTAKFNVIQETNFGVKTIGETFTFPLGLGKYNIGGYGNNFNSYLDRLTNIASLYDERYSDNIYRMMTHETIKNFDFTRRYDNDNEEDYQEGHDKLAAVLRVFGREFDVIRQRIESITDNNSLSYKELTETQEKYLPYSVKNEGIDIRNIYPIKLEQTSGNCFNVEFDLNYKVQPYLNKYNYYYNGGKRTEYSGDDTANEIITDDGCVARIFKQYTTKNYFSSKYINSEFLKRLRLNSKELFRYKGTTCGIEMILAMFGLKSKRMVERLDNYDEFNEVFKDIKKVDDYDYEIFESWTDDITPISDDCDITKIKFYNSAKTTEYIDDSRFYGGLPIKEVKQYNGDTLVGTTIHPYFDDTKTYDGGMYYQMNGGWLKYNIGEIFNKDNCLITNNGNGYPLYTETIRNIRSVTNIQELLNLPYNELSYNMIVKISNIDENVLISCKTIYNVYTDEQGGEYIIVQVNDGVVQIGDREPITSLVTKVYSEGAYQNVSYDDLSYLPSGFNIKWYLDHVDRTLFDYIKGDGTRPNFKSEYKRYKYSSIGEDGSENDTFYNSIVNWEDTEEADVIKINHIVNYYEGNNPHSGNLNYDDGEEYLNRYRKLFKYALENNAFDVRCFGSQASYENSKQDIGSIGFNTINWDYKEIPSGISTTDIENAENNQDEFYKKVNYVKNSNSEGTYYDDPFFESYKVMNLKNMKIDFSKLFAKYGSDNSFRKFFQSVIVRYLEQFIPSTSICEIVA